MADDNRLVEIMAEVLVEMKGMRQEQKETNQKLDKLTERVDRLEERQAKTNLGLSEVRQSVMTLADKSEIVFKHEARIVRLEAEVFKNAS